MARYDVLPNAEGEGYLLDVQADLLDELRTRVVVPLVPAPPEFKPVRVLNPVVPIGGKQYVMLTHLIATVPVAKLGEPRANLATLHEQIDVALEMLFRGF